MQHFQKQKELFQDLFNAAGCQTHQAFAGFLEGTELPLCCWKFGRLFSFKERHHPPQNDRVSEDTVIIAASGEINPATFLDFLYTENGSSSPPSPFDRVLNTPMDMQLLRSSSKRLKHSKSCFSSATEAIEAATPNSCVLFDCI
jgi:hypothetical protein